MEFQDLSFVGSEDEKTEAKVLLVLVVDNDDRIFSLQFVAVGVVVVAAAAV